MLSQLLRQSLQEADFLKCSLVDWSCIGGIQGLMSGKTRKTFLDGERDAFLYAYDKYYQSIWGTVFFNLLGEKLLAFSLSRQRKLHVLDVGCGASKHFCNMFEGLPDISPDTCLYTSIDKEKELTSIETTDDINKNRLEWLGQHVDRKHITMDVFDQKNSNTLGDNDLMIIDIEPHGKEWEVYQKFLPYMNQTHMLILKCIGNMCSFGSEYAETFISKVNESEHLKIIDQAAWFWSQEKDYEVLNIYPRDVVLVIEKPLCCKIFQRCFPNA